MNGMNGDVLRPLLLTLAFVLLGCSSAPLVTRVHDAGAFSDAKSVSINDFSAPGRGFLDTPARSANWTYKGDTDTLGRTMAMLLRSELLKNAGGLPVSVEGDDSASADLIVEGRFTTIDEGDAILGEVTVGVEGMIRQQDGTVVAEFGKTKTSRGGLFGLGLMAGGSGRIIRDIMSDIASGAAKFIARNVSQEVVLAERPMVQQPELQEPAPPMEITDLNSMYLESGGNCLAFSVNYDRLLSPRFGFRIGMFAFALPYVSTEAAFSTTLMGNYFIGSESHKLEIGLGVYIANHEFSGPLWEDGPTVHISEVAGTGTVGYRYQPPDGGLMFRLGLTPFFAAPGVVPNLGFSVGYAF